MHYPTTYPIQSRPYLAESCNVFNEANYNANPMRFGPGNVLVSHGQQRNVYDTTSTSVVGQPQLQTQPQSLIYYQQQEQRSPATYSYPTYPVQEMHPQYQCPCHPAVQQQNQHLPMYRQYTQDGVEFSFGSNCSHYNSYPNQLQIPPAQGAQYSECFCQTMQQQFDQLNLQQQIALKQLEKHGLETLLLQEQLKRNPFMLQLHHNRATSTEDLFDANDQIPKSEAMPDLKSAAIQTVIDGNVDFYLRVNPRRLNLTKSPDLVYSSHPPRDYNEFLTSVGPATVSERICHCSVNKPLVENVAVKSDSPAEDTEDLQDDRELEERKRSITFNDLVTEFSADELIPTVSSAETADSDSDSDERPALKTKQNKCIGKKVKRKGRNKMERK